MTTKERVAQELDGLNTTELGRVRRFVGYLKKRSQKAKLSDKTLQNLYRQFAREDREIADEGMSDYLNALKREDAE